MTITDVLALAALLGLIPAVVAQRKGRSFLGWWIFGFLMLIVALPAAFLVRDTRPRCSRCAEPVRPDASRCPHCQAEIIAAN
jgi:hypothetical protein